MQFYWLVKLSLPPHNIIVLLLTTFSPITFSLTLHRRQKKNTKKNPNEQKIVCWVCEQANDRLWGGLRWKLGWKWGYFYIKSIFSVHFLASPSDPCCLSTTVHPNHSTHPSCSFFSQYTFFLCTFRRRRIFFRVLSPFFIYTQWQCVSLVWIFFLSSSKDGKIFSLWHIHSIFSCLIYIF